MSPALVVSDTLSWLAASPSKTGSEETFHEPVGREEINLVNIICGVTKPEGSHSGSTCVGTNRGV